ncbi:hydrogenase maturation protease [Hippea maritima]|uniref:Hydrogenase maturation protease n=1 Tax=Hippea maritima (strain ATCC 700847 / DSM 10411 / MH2) TaxID=760142 RepID=F2LWC7_HIPMA|nr:hydrogenase maturation protease [Hippea maritima]AEA34061.1 hydrogenase maturation protease [Hippea maritima DSM 10411]
MNEIAVVGLGNLLLADEGFGVHLIRYLQDNYVFENVDIIDGGTIGFGLIEYFLTYKNLVFVDAIRINDKPGSIYKFSLSEVPPNLTFVSSIHEIGLGDVLHHVKLMGEDRDATVVGVVPLAITPNDLSTELTGLLRLKIEPVASIVLDEVERLGGIYARRGDSRKYS